jgi:hypothetical protein
MAVFSFCLQQTIYKRFSSQIRIDSWIVPLWNWQQVCSSKLFFAVAVSWKYEYFKNSLQVLKDINTGLLVYIIINYILVEGLQLWTELMVSIA